MLELSMLSHCGKMVLSVKIKYIMSTRRILVAMTVSLEIKIIGRYLNLRKVIEYNFILNQGIKYLGFH